jgi:hypothetical protein
MKTQLLEDFQESGSAPAQPAPPPSSPPSPPPPRPRRPAVWHGPGAQRTDAGASAQRADPGPMQRAPNTPARGKGVAIEAWAERAARARPTPSPPVDDATVPLHDPPARPEPAPDPVPPPRPFVPPEPHAGDAGTIPRPMQPDAEADWLAARLHADDTPAWSSVWKRRLVTWSIAGGLLAGLAAGGLWLYEENRVEGALVVVANTSPAGQGPAGQGQAPAAQAFAAGAPVPAPVQPAAAAEAVRPLPAPEPVAPAVERDPPAAAPVDVTPPKRTLRDKTAAKKRAPAQAKRRTVQDAPPATAAHSARERREETLMQCRAHGYDARQCIERACTMTRYGFACKG